VPELSSALARAAWRALRSSTAACTFCGSDNTRPSRKMYGLVPRFLGLRAWRCLDCGRRFPLRGGVTKVRSWTPPGEDVEAAAEVSRPPRVSSRSAERARQRRRAMLVRAAYVVVLMVVLLAAVLAWRPAIGLGGSVKKWKPPVGAKPWRQ
jgi:hypothetical protein